MREIKNILICGIGAVGSIYADKISRFSRYNLRILVNEERLIRYSTSPVVFNGNELILNYILPENEGFKADLIIIATKFSGLNSAIKNIKNFVGDDTIIISLLNGVISENLIAEEYGWDKILLSYFIGHSAMRDGRFIIHDGVGKIVFGTNGTDKTNEFVLKHFFDDVEIDYDISNDIKHSLWLKYMMNVGTNQLSALLGMTFGEMNKNEKFLALAKKIMMEVEAVAKAEGVRNTEFMLNEAMVALSEMIPEGKTSMYQDILAGRNTEVEMFAGTMIKLGKKHNIPVPFNEFIYELFMIIHRNFELKRSLVIK